MLVLGSNITNLPRFLRPFALSFSLEKIEPKINSKMHATTERAKSKHSSTIKEYVTVIMNPKRVYREKWMANISNAFFYFSHSSQPDGKNAYRSQVKRCVAFDWIWLSLQHLPPTKLAHFFAVIDFCLIYLQCVMCSVLQINLGNSLFKYDFAFTEMAQKSTFQTRCTAFTQSTLRTKRMMNMRDKCNKLVGIARKKNIPQLNSSNMA